VGVRGIQPNWRAVGTRLDCAVVPGHPPCPTATITTTRRRTRSAALAADAIAAENQYDRLPALARQYDLQDAGQILTSAVADRWAQSPYKVQFRADGQRFFTEIEELDRNIGMLPLEEQSRGFQWFFSFDLRFMHDSGGTFAGCVLLLDQPGMHLHPGGRDDLLRRFDAYARENTLIYTTHLPFLVDIREPSRIHVMKEREDRSATVSNDLAASGPDEKLTLQAALGIKASQQELVAHKNLVVAGSDELFILTALSNLLERSDRPGLADDIAIIAAGSASAIVYRSTFMVGQGLFARLDQIKLVATSGAMLHLP
jgi:hypothetical protein